jgi:hypothetical protein
MAETVPPRGDGALLRATSMSARAAAGCASICNISQPMKQGNKAAFNQGRDSALLRAWSMSARAAAPMCQLRLDLRHNTTDNDEAGRQNSTQTWYLHTMMVRWHDTRRPMVTANPASDTR